jgi:hypothetical protein
MSTETFSEIGIYRPSIIKDPDASLDYAFDWTDWLDAGEAIASWSTTVSGVTKIADDRVGAVITVWVSGGTASPGSVATITCAITTDSAPARIDNRTIYLKIKET